jgi:hypothetical protein
MKNLKIFFCIVFLMLIAVSATAQTTHGRLAGVVRDTSGGVIPNAEVTITNVRTGAQRIIRTNSEGEYLATTLPPSEYDVRVTAGGFSVTEIKKLILEVGQVVTHDFVVKPAGVETEVQVYSGLTSELDTSTATIGANVASREIQNLPINGRQISQLYLLVPGATNSGTGTFDNLRFSGRAVEQNVIRLDGI